MIRLVWKCIPKSNALDYYPQFYDGGQIQSFVVKQMNFQYLIFKN